MPSTPSAQFQPLKEGDVGTLAVVDRGCCIWLVCHRPHLCPKGTCTYITTRDVAMGLGCGSSSSHLLHCLVRLVSKRPRHAGYPQSSANACSHYLGGFCQYCGSGRRRGRCGALCDDAGRRGYSRTQASMAVLLQIATDFGSFCLILIAGIIWIAREHALRWYELGAAIILLAYVGGIALLLVIGLLHPVWLQSRFGHLQQWVNRLGVWMRRSEFAAPRLEYAAGGRIDWRLTAIARKPGGVALTTAIGFSSHLVNLGTLYCLFLAFNQPVSLGTLVAGYSMCILFSIVSPTSNGVGIVEALMPVVLDFVGCAGSGRRGDQPQFPRADNVASACVGFCAFAPAEIVCAAGTQYGRNRRGADGGLVDGVDGNHQRAFRRDAHLGGTGGWLTTDFAIGGTPWWAFDLGIGRFCLAYFGARAQEP